MALNASTATVVYTFDAASAGGVTGTITTLVGATSTQINADLDLSNANWTALTAFDGNCTGAVSEFTWHIHSKWDNTKTSEFTTGCSLAKAGNHYDPEYACGPNSEFAKEPQCANKISTYNCSAATYATNASVCEKGDLSGHVGKMKAVNQKISASWTDKGNYPTVAEHKPQWNIMLHAVCGTATPRFICATGKLLSTGDNTTKPNTTKPTTTTAPTSNSTNSTPAAPSTPKPSSGSTIKATVATFATLAIAAVLF